MAPLDVNGAARISSSQAVTSTIGLKARTYLSNRRDAAVADLLCGPLAALPAFVFFACMIAFYPQIGDVALPSNYILERLNAPLFHMTFQLMIFVALLETSASAVNGLNERLASVFERRERNLVLAVASPRQHGC
ncbi:MAG TPA: hypothetical protein VKN76_00510 [Kiloniellaceae bacterium]|nr:hypothetical protein [Kiloniellaceae bacterium]